MLYNLYLLPLHVSTSIIFFYIFSSFSAIFELLFPIIVILLSSTVRNLIDKDQVAANPSEKFVLGPSVCHYNRHEIIKLTFAPENNFTTKLMMEVTKMFYVDLIPFENEVKLNNWIKNKTEPVAAVIFEEVW
jgi:hypothetical protein